MTPSKLSHNDIAAIGESLERVEKPEEEAEEVLGEMTAIDDKAGYPLRRQSRDDNHLFRSFSMAVARGE